MERPARETGPVLITPASTARPRGGRVNAQG